MHQINPQKLLHSKWTAVIPSNKEKHFMVSELEFNEDKQVVSCILEAVMTKRSNPIQWQELKDSSLWLQGWK